MPAAIIVAEVIVADVVATAATDYIAAAVADTILADVFGTTVATAIGTGAVGGATAGAVGALATGGDVGEAIGKGALGGAVAGGVTSGLTGTTGGVDPKTGATIEPSGARGLTGSEAGGKALARAAGGTAGGLATGKDLKSAATSGLISAGVDYLYGEPAPDATSTDKALLGTEKALTSAYVNKLFAPEPTRTAQTAGGGFTPSDTGTGTQTAGAGQAPGSQALAQALRVGDAGGPIFGGGGEDTQKKSGWNVESLRYMGQEA